MSNAEDLNRLTACSLVLLGHIFYVLGNHRVSACLACTHLRSTTMEHSTSYPEVQGVEGLGSGVRVAQMTGSLSGCICHAYKPQT